MYKDKEKVDEAIRFASTIAMDLTGFINIQHEWIDDTHVKMFSGHDCEGSPADDIPLMAELVERLTGWKKYEITDYDSYDNYSGEPYYVGLKAPDAE